MRSDLKASVLAARATLESAIDVVRRVDATIARTIRSLDESLRVNLVWSGPGQIEREALPPIPDEIASLMREVSPRASSSNRRATPPTSRPTSGRRHSTVPVPDSRTRWLPDGTTDGTHKVHERVLINADRHAGITARSTGANACGPRVSWACHQRVGMIQQSRVEHRSFDLKHRCTAPKFAILSGGWLESGSDRRPGAMHSVRWRAATHPCGVRRPRSEGRHDVASPSSEGAL